MKLAFAVQPRQRALTFMGLWVQGLGGYKKEWGFSAPEPEKAQRVWVGLGFGGLGRPADRFTRIPQNPRDPEGLEFGVFGLLGFIGVLRSTVFA